MSDKTRQDSPGAKTARAAKGFSRRTVLKSAAAAGTFAALGPYLLTDEAKAASGELKVLIWTGYIPQSVREKFEADTGVSIKVTNYGSNEELLNKLKATKGRGFDLISPTLNREPQWNPLGLRPEGMLVQEHPVAANQTRDRCRGQQGAPSTEYEVQPDAQVPAGERTLQ